MKTTVINKSSLAPWKVKDVIVNGSSSWIIVKTKEGFALLNLADCSVYSTRETLEILEKVFRALGDRTARIVELIVEEV